MQDNFGRTALQCCQWDGDSAAILRGAGTKEEEEEEEKVKKEKKEKKEKEEEEKKRCTMM